MNGRSAYYTASAGGQAPSLMWVSSQLAAVKRQLHGSIPPRSNLLYLEVKLMYVNLCSAMYFIFISVDHFDHVA